MSYLFTSSALVLRPLPGSPLHLNQNLSSKFFNSDGFLPQSDAPGISLSSRNDPLDIFDNKLERVASGLLIPWPYLPRSDAISHHSARAIRHYESRVFKDREPPKTIPYSAARTYIAHLGEYPPPPRGEITRFFFTSLHGILWMSSVNRPEKNDQLCLTQYFRL